MNENDYGVPIPGEPVPREQWAKTAIKRLPPDGPLDFEVIFGRKAPLVLDLGCGNGRFTLTHAIAHPEMNHFAIDALPVVIRYATKRANQRGLENVRIAVCDADRFVAKFVRPKAAQEIHLYHPQPYHDPSQAERRLLTPKFLVDVYEALADDGVFIWQTDNRQYAAYMRQASAVFFNVTDHPDPWPDAPLGRTRREIYSLQHGLPLARAICRPKLGLSRQECEELAGTMSLPDFDTVKKPVHRPIHRRRTRGRRPGPA
jgi:tRNA (guanine-N7-)-methyltransferase